MRLDAFADPKFVERSMKISNSLKSTNVDYIISMRKIMKGIPNGFPGRISRSMREGCGETFGKCGKIHQPQASVFVSFPKVEPHHNCMDHAMLNRRTIW